MSPSRNLEPPKLNVLVAYPYATEATVAAIKALGPNVRWLLDSGAFTAWKQGKPIALDDYCRFIERLPVEPWRYFMLDVIGQPEATARNYAAMRARGFAPVPIFTRGAPLEELEALYQTTDLVGIGGLVTRKQSPKAYLKWLWPRLRGRRVHLLGFTQPEWLKHFRPYSCDSTSWMIRAAKYGCIPLYMGNGRFTNVSREDFRTRPPQAIVDRLAYYGLDPFALTKAEAWTNKASAQARVAVRACVRSFIHFSIDIERNTGTHFFLAAGPADIELLQSEFIKAKSVFGASA